jgi:photosystem II stability/assembly factor-like uncharacterized protein
VGTAGTILATTNGGAHWSPQDSGTSAWLRAVACSDATHAWAVGALGTILATKDDGVTWHEQSSGISSDLFAVACSDALHAWAEGIGGNILVTTDGGADWNPQSSGSSASLQGVVFKDATHGWIVGTNGTILATASGGFPTAPTAPSISKLSPTSAKRGVTVTISGSRFGATRGAGSVKFGAKACAKYVSWSATKIKCKVPATAAFGTIKVTVATAGGKSNAKNFTVKR